MLLKFDIYGVCYIFDMYTGHDTAQTHSKRYVSNTEHTSLDTCRSTSFVTGVISKPLVLQTSSKYFIPRLSLHQTT